ncbi:Prohibitin [Galemys pyrenaicus]|uniref:Prohibitin n=1 Tax=Galemys pyrenaicus TaxID=202257 RepID=A0A8J6A0P5_GALPY|nr:Prohibitin [Galemys pyrenaicus]
MSSALYYVGTELPSLTCSLECRIMLPYAFTSVRERIMMSVCCRLTIENLKSVVVRFDDPAGVSKDLTEQVATCGLILDDAYLTHLTFRKEFVGLMGRRFNMWLSRKQRGGKKEVHFKVLSSLANSLPLVNSLVKLSNLEANFCALRTSPTC